MARATSRNSGVTVEGLSESLRALNRIDKGVAKEAKGIIREHTKPIAMAARKVNSGSPTEASRKTWISWSITNKGAAIKLRAAAFPRALQTEFGAEWQKTGYEDSDKEPFRRQKTLRRRTTNPATRYNADVLDGDSGYVIQPTIRRMLPKFLDDLTDDLGKFMSKELDKAGVPRRGRA